MEALKALMRFFSYLFHALLALFLLAVSGLAWATGSAQSLNLGMLPWTGSTLTYVVFFGALFGVIAVAIAVRGGALRVLFLIWALAVFAFLVKGYILSGYHFSGDWKTAFYLLLASLFAIPGALLQMRRRPARRRF